MSFLDLPAPPARLPGTVRVVRNLAMDAPLREFSPELRAHLAEVMRERMVRLHADPEFRARHSAQARETALALNARRREQKAES